MPARPERAASGQKWRHDRWRAMFVEKGWYGDGDLVKASAPQLEEIGRAISAVEAINGSVGIGANGQKCDLCDIYAIGVAHVGGDDIRAEIGWCEHR